MVFSFMVIITMERPERQLSITQPLEIKKAPFTEGLQTSPIGVFVVVLKRAEPR